MGAAFALLVSASLFAGAALGQGADPPGTSVEQEGEGTWHEDVLRIKVAPDVAGQATPMKQNGVAMLGVPSIDALNQEYDAVSIEPLFDVGGEYEERHRDYGLHRWYEIRLADGKASADTDVERVMGAYSNASAVSVAEGKARAEQHVTERGSVPATSLLDPLPGPPDDPLFGDQYGFQNIEAGGGWQTRTGDTTVVVSIHDSGISGSFDGSETDLNHPDLEPNVWYGGDPSDGSVHGKNFRAGDPADLTDNNGHGTHVTGTVAAATNNGFGVAGTAGGNGEFADGRGDGVRFMVTPGLNQPDAYIYAADNGAAVSQNSWGFTSPGVFPQSLQDAIDYFIDNGGGDDLDGGIVVFSAGNDADNGDWFPAAYEPIVSVASTDQADNVSTFSNFGEWVDIAAPGTGILSTWIAGQGSVESNFEFLSGTSMAAPHVSGAAALVVSEFSDVSSPDQVESILKESADDIGATLDIGAGRLNLAQALQEDDGTAPAAITDLSVTDVASAHVDLQWTAPDGEPTVYDIRYSTDPIEGDQDFENATQADDPPSPSAPGETDEAEVEGLTPGTEYFFAVKSSDTFGSTSDLSNVASATTENAPAIAVDPESVSQTLNTGESGTDNFSILNVGEDTLSFALQAGTGGSDIADPIGEPTEVRSLVGALPTRLEQIEANQPQDRFSASETTHKPEEGAVQQQSTEVEGRSLAKLLDEVGTTGFGNDTFNQEFEIYSFDLGVPSELTLVDDGVDSFAGNFIQGNNEELYWIDNADNNLKTYALDDGTVETIGELNPQSSDPGWTDLETDYSTGTTYVTTTDALYELDPQNAELTLVGELPGSLLPVAFAIDAEGQGYLHDIQGDNILTVDLQTAETEVLGSTGIDANFAQSMTYDHATDQLLMAAYKGSTASVPAELREVDTETGNTELIAPIGPEGESNELGWFATPGPSFQWLAAEPTEGEVAAGDPGEEITLTLETVADDENANNLIGGLEYSGSVQVESNDPGTPVEEVPVTLTVEGTPAISVDESLDFGEVFAGTTGEDTLTVTNTSDDAILQVASIELAEGDTPFSVADASPFVLNPGQSGSIPLVFEPTENGSFETTLSFANSATGTQEVTITGQGSPFVSIEPDALEQEIDLTTGDSTATQEFTITNEFSESLPFSVLIESLESESMDITPKLADEKLQRWRQIQQTAPQLDGETPEPSLEPAPSEGQATTPAAARLLDGPQVLEETGVTAYGAEVIAPELVAFDVGLPGEFTVVDEGVDSFAGNFTFGNNEEIFWIDNTDNTLKTYALADGTVESIGELDPVGSDVTWSDLETNPTDGTTYVTAGEGNTNRLYELDVDDAELDLVGEYASGNLVVALAIDGEGNAYAHEIANDEILSVDLETAETEVVGPTGIDANFAQSMTYDAETGQVLMAALHDCGLFGCGSGTLRQVDRETGNTTLIGPFPEGGNDELGWMATPGQGIPWLATNLENGTVPAGATLELEAEYDATQIVEGDYEAQISIVGNQLQGEPSESVPVNLSVEAAPISFVSKDSLGYEDLFVDDTSSTQMVTLRNDGAADLNVTNVSVDSENFAFTGGSEFTLEPGDAQIFDVAFTPQSVGEFTATMTIEGEEISTREVTLVGEGIPAPALSLTPTGFDKQAYVGQTQEETVEVTNTGGNPLEYDLSVLPSSPPVQQLLLEEGFGGEEFPPGDWFRAGANDGENWTTVGEDCTFSFDDPEQACFYWSPSTEGTQRLITPQFNTEDLGQVFVQFTHQIDAFTPGEFMVRLETTGDGGETWTTVKEFPADDVGPIDEMIAIDNENVGSDEFHVAWTFEGDSFNIDGWAVDDVQVFAGGEWLAVDQTSGTIEPSESDTLNLAVDTNVPGIEENTYQSGLGFVTNAPLAETAELPFTLDVIEALSVTPQDEGDGEIFPSETFTLNMDVESLDDLEVFSYQMEMGFNTDRMQVQEVTTEGTLSEGLTLTSDVDNEAGTVTIAAADDGVASNGTESGESDGDDGAALFDIEGEGVLVSIKATGQPDHGEMVMNMEEMTFNEGEPPATPVNDTMEVVPLYGDTDLNLSITAGDAGSTLDFVVGTTDLLDAQQTHADVSGDGDVSAFDASLILQRTVGGISCFPAAPDCEEGTEEALATTSKASGDAGTSFAWGDVTEPKQSVSTESAKTELPLVLNQIGTSVQAIDVSTKIDRDKVAVNDMTAQLPDDWQAVHHVADNGTLKISMAGTTPIANPGKVATLTLEREKEDATLKIGGNVAVNESATQELETKSLVSIPDEFALEGAYPNPFRQAATLEMDLPQKANVTVEVYDLLGRKVQTAHRGELSAGAGRTVRVNGSDLSSGTYFYRARVEMDDNRVTETGKMTVVR
ncbi:S8 family serine peptidase [Salinibacter altiplanensis]|uniref:S8 family serine peptidase n=1 Tax=Salinibacter altiplanensis TaxID=1803181 RepID=UPI001F47F7EF|nr:S8 family serine peptidase [Salinibacter altiplanensis]